MKLRISLPKKVVALGLSFCTAMSLATSAFASGKNNTSYAKIPCITYVFDVYSLTGYNVHRYDIPGYIVLGLKTENISENDVSLESLKKTQITGESDMAIRISNPYCSIKVMFAFTALYALGYDETKIINFISQLAERGNVRGNIPLRSFYLGVIGEFNKFKVCGKYCNQYRWLIAEKMREAILISEE